MMDLIEDFISDFLVCSDDQRSIILLWILHTYCYQIAAYSPYLNIYSLIEESGKSACLTLLRSLCADPWAASGVSTSVLQRRIIANRPTVLMDNWHTTFRTDKQHITGFLLNGCQSFQPYSLADQTSYARHHNDHDDDDDDQGELK